MLLTEADSFAAAYPILLVYPQSDSPPRREISNAFLLQAFFSSFSRLLHSSLLTSSTASYTFLMIWNGSNDMLTWGKCSRNALRFPVQSDAEVRRPFISRAGIIFIPTTYYHDSWWLAHLSPSFRDFFDAVPFFCALMVSHLILPLSFFLR